ncbi:MAG: DNA repair protein RadA [Lachnospiraceae bacterium]|nr:DNA repair protein RadA [Lachnospiraceae bacterium]
MARPKTVFFCSDCGYESGKWMGQCPSCKAWNTFVEAPAAPKKAQTAARGGGGLAAGLPQTPKTLKEIDTDVEERAASGFGELDRVLGGGIVKGSLVLIGGDPGIGKSTILLQVCRNLAAAGQNVLYISGEESLRQIRMRAERIGECADTLSFLCETDAERIMEVLHERRPDTVVIDSIQTMYREDVTASPGSPTQIRECTMTFMQAAKGFGISMFLVGHVTKEGTVAGPRMLEHMVDTVLYFEGEKSAAYRILRSVKNRFGATNEIGVFEMREDGLAEVPDPSGFLLDGRPKGAPGSVVTCSMEGTRPLLVEIQALACKTNFAAPRRTAAGVDYNRLNLLIAVMEKRAGVKLWDEDVYVNIAGGMRVTEPSADLGVVLAIASSLADRPVPEGVIAFGEVGLSGEVRSVSRAADRVREAARQGFTTCILPKVCVRGLKDAGQIDGMKILGVSSVSEALRNI